MKIEATPAKKENVEAYQNYQQQEMCKRKYELPKKGNEKYKTSRNLMLAFVFDMLASPPTSKPAKEK